MPFRSRLRVRYGTDRQMDRQTDRHGHQCIMPASYGVGGIIIVRAMLYTDHEVRLKALYTDLATRFCAVSAAAWMFQHGALTIKELQSIQCQRDRPVAAAETLLGIIIEQPCAVYDCFLDALKHSNQQHVYQWIVYDANNSGQNGF